jgi:PadR family transcriptional regulator, regulatory protein AphA
MSELGWFRTSELALLGVLAQGGAMSGYDVRAYIKASVSQFWSESFGQIYPALDRLKRRGLVKNRRDPASARSRMVYEITPRGRKTLREWLAKPPEPERPRSEVILKTFLGDHATPGVTEEHLRDFASRADARATELEQVEVEVRRQNAGSKSLAYWVASIRAGILLSRARAAWAHEAIGLIGGVQPERTSDGHNDERSFRQ